MSSNGLNISNSLSVDVLWLMPIYPSPSVHGYDVADFYDVNPEYGTREDLIQLVEAAHARDMRIILDFVPSHLSDENPLFAHAYARPSSDQADWFVWTNEAHTTYAGFAGSRDMPRFNHYNPEVVDYLSRAALYWLDLDQDGDYQDGVDGFRIDNVTFPPQEFFVELRGRVKAVNPDALLLGEAWVHTPQDLARFFDDQFDALFDFPFYELLEGSQDINGDGVLAGSGFPGLLDGFFETESQAYPGEGYLLRFLNNHDTNRIMNEVKGDGTRARLVPALLAALPGPVMLYYGEEIGMPGEKGPAPYWDSYRREPMDWYAAGAGPLQASWFNPADSWDQPSDGISVEEQDGDPGSLLTFYRRAMSLKATVPALQGQAFEPLSMEVSGPGVWGFQRGSGDDRLVALFNFSAEERSVLLPVIDPDDAYLDLYSGTILPNGGGGKFNIDLEPGQAMLLSSNP